jgi:sugar lactone lactonase YvrE
MRTSARVLLVVSMLLLPAALAGGSSRAHSAAAPATTPPACTPWSVRTLLSGQGWLENLAFDGRGSITLSALAQGRILRLTPSRRLSTLLTPVVAPGGERVRGRYLYFVTGDTVPVTPTGTLDRLDLRTGRRSTVAQGLTMPNGLALLPNGDAVVSRDLGTGTGLTRIRARDPRHPQIEWAKLDDTNGLAVDPTGRWLYTDRTLSPDGEVDRVLIANPSVVQVVGRLGAGVSPDDLTVDKRGTLFIAGFSSGRIYRLNPRTHAACFIASGLAQPTSPRFGGRGWHANDLYVTDAGGHLSQLTPPRP